MKSFGRVLVTGGAGFIGSHLVARLQADGCEVVVLDNLSSGRPTNVAPDVRLIEGDIRDQAACAEAVRACDAVFHLAAHRAVLRSVEEPVETDRANVGGTLNLLDEARRNDVERFVFASSSSVYGGWSTGPVAETDVKTPKSPYAVSKLAGEEYVRVYSDLYEMTTTSLRFFNVYGPNQSPLSRYACVVPLFLQAMQHGESPVVEGDGHQSRDFTYVSDVVDAMLLSAKAPAEQVSGQAFNVGAGGTHSVLELVQELSALLGIEVEPKFTKPRPGDVRVTWADNTKARQVLGWVPQFSFRQGLQRTVEAWGGTVRDAA